MSGIMTRPEAEKQAESIIKALEEMPADAEERESYLESLKKLNEEFSLGLSGEIQELEVAAEESETEVPPTETEELDLSSVSKDGNENENETETGDDGNMQNNNEKGFAAQVKAFLNTHLFGGVQWSHVVAALLAVITLLLVQSAITSDADELNQQIADLTRENIRLQTGWNAANTTAPAGECACEFNASTEEAAVAAATAELEQDLSDCENETGGVSIGEFTDEETKDWIDGTLSLKDTAVNSFVPFESTDEALEFVKEVYPYNTGHNLKWNNEEANLAIADEHKGDRDDVKMLFSASNNNLYAVVPSESNYVIPTVYKYIEEDNDWALEEYDGSKVTVVAMDKLKKSSSED